MKKLSALLMICVLLFSAVYAEGIDEIEQVEEGLHTEENNQTQENNQSEEDKAEDQEQTGEKDSAGETETGADEKEPAQDQSSVQLFVVMDEDGALIASSGAGTQISLSSMTHLLLMTALDEKYKQTDDMGSLKAADDYESLYAQGLDIVGGEEFKALDLYKTLFLKSPNDVALLFAQRDLGGEEAPSKLSALAAEIGLGSTAISDLFGASNSTTPYDVAKLFIHNYKNSERFREASALASISIADTGFTGPREVVSSSAFVLDTGMTIPYKDEEKKVFDQAVLAGKTVYSEDGSYVMLTMMKSSDKALVFVTAGNQDIESAYLGHRILQDKILNDYQALPYLKAGKAVKALKGGTEEKSYVEMSPKSDVILFLPKNYDMKKLECRYQTAANGVPQIAIYKEGALYKLADASVSGQGRIDSYLGEVKDVETQKTGKEKALDLVKILFKIIITLALWLGAVALNRLRIRNKKKKFRDRTRG